MDDSGFTNMDYGQTSATQARARFLVWNTAYNILGEKKAHPTFSIEEVVLVWFNYTLGNWKALYTTTLSDGRYYEVTYSMARDEVYVDVYRKTHQFIFDAADVVVGHT